MPRPEGIPANEPWPPEDCVAVGDYVFSESMAPTLEQVEEAETFIFTRAEFLGLTEEQRRRNVMRLAMAAGGSNLSAPNHLRAISFIPLIGGPIAVVDSRLHDGTVVSRYYDMEEYQAEHGQA